VDRETEVKIAVDDAEEAAGLLQARGAVPRRPRELEDNVLFDREGGELARQGKLLRLRRVGTRAILTVKAPLAGAVPGAYKVRRELETEIENPDALAETLVAIGFRPVWRYQKWRRTFALEGAEVTVDELPFGTFLEIEGEPLTIDRAARALGFGQDRYETASYRELHERDCRAAGRSVGDLVFPAPGGNA
jgi:adenylate cyclase class 2